MLKTLAAKAIIPVAVSITGFVVACCILLFSSMKHDRIEEHVRHANDVASVVVKSTRYAMLKADRETLRNIVANVGEEALVEHVRIFNKQGIIVFSGREGEVGQVLDKDAEGCSVCHAAKTPVAALGPMEQARRYTNDQGAPVLAITAPLYNEPECATGGCHHHPAGQSVLGTLDIGLSERGLQTTLRVTRQRLTLFSFMVLVLSVGGVAALLRRNVVGPIQQLAEYAVRAERGEGNGPLPATEGELGRIAGSVQRLRRRLDALEGRNGRG